MAKLLKIWFYSFITIISLLPDIKKVTCNDNSTVATAKKLPADNTKVHYIVTTSHARTTSVPVVRLSPATTTTTVRTTTAALARTTQQTSELSCSSVKKWWLSKGIDKKHVSDHSLKNDSHLGTCMRGGGLRTCCTQVMEHKLEQIARQQLNTTIFKHQVERLKDSFSEKAIALFGEFTFN
ncbi:hypothetical protein HELRODRAFT_170136 [Helobdella robusta]|uniref:Uncharacterized protein n=1 Tax=Helobdella robusta TaxID=6412 RepID=T1F2P4_HELRO|nr:hypothetical protein HELRODRAFT_170136 [Helobdella robusta]ESO07588.1 hypothetical protein HELRODRAFT_170136 [Helobdella robusta]